MREILKYNASVNFYMFHGGTNFAFMNGANKETTYKPDVSSYGKIPLYLLAIPVCDLCEYFVKKYVYFIAVLYFQLQIHMKLGSKQQIFYIVERWT